MVEVKGFQGYRFNASVLKVTDCIMPPYDAVSEVLIAKLRNHPHNFIHLNLNPSHDDAAKKFYEWLDSGVLLKDDKDSIYVYQQEFTVGETAYKRTGFISLLKLEELGEYVLPHEHTMDKHIEDRLSLMEKTQANFGNIFMVYKDQERSIDMILERYATGNTDITYVDEEGCSHRLWKITDEKDIASISETMKDKQVVIADGHHRYKTALRYKEKNPDVKGNDYVLTTMVNGYNEGLIILPTNRLIPDRVDLTKLEPYFNITPIGGLQDFEPGSFIIASGDTYNHLRLKSEDVLDEVFSGEESIYKGLDVAILHKIIFDKVLEVDSSGFTQDNFIKGNEATLLAVKDKSMTAFFVNPPSLEQTFNIAEKGRVMPQKSTYFYPKMFSGLVINKFG